MTEQHEYPSRYMPGTHWAVDAAWEILDSLKPGAISMEARCFLAGMIAGRLTTLQQDMEDGTLERFTDSERHRLLTLALNAVPQDHGDPELTQIIARLSGTDTVLIARRAYPSRESGLS